MSYDVFFYETDEHIQNLDPYAEGIHHRLLRKAWAKGSLPKDMESLANLAKIRPSSLQKIWPQLDKLWETDPQDSTRLINIKLKIEKDFLDLRRDQNSKAGKLSAKSRENKGNDSTPVQHEVNIRSTPPLSSPLLPSSNTNTVNNSSLTHSRFKNRWDGSEYSPEFCGFWDGSTKRGSKFDAWRAWKKINPDQELQMKMNSAMAAWKLSDQWQDESKQPHVTTWLNRRGWEEIIPRSLGSHNGNGNGHKTREQRTLEASRRVGAFFSFEDSDNV